MKSLGPFSIDRVDHPAIVGVPAFVSYQFIIQVSSRTSFQILLVRFEEGS